ncbi:hypothetical protein Btru_003521 [Bulinus truncatus]|nr:hypothetical protein Btru_003521 [Bulinus truncatus]
MKNEKDHNLGGHRINGRGVNEETICCDFLGQAQAGCLTSDKLLLAATGASTFPIAASRVCDKCLHCTRQGVTDTYVKCSIGISQMKNDQASEISDKQGEIIYCGACSLRVEQFIRKLPPLLTDCTYSVWESQSYGPNVDGGIYLYWMAAREYKQRADLDDG